MNRISLLGLVVLVGVGATADFSATRVRAASQDPAPEGPEGPEAIRDRAAGQLRALERLDASFPHPPLTPAELTARTRTGGTADVADAVTHWVADSVGWLPYRGALRGPRGVLIERRGNSLDQSLLLGEALAAAGLEVRLARAALSEEQAAALYAELRPLRETEAAPPADVEEQRRAQFAEVAAILEVDVAELERQSAALEIQAQRYLERVLPMTVALAEGLKGLLAEQDVEPPRLDVPLDTSEREALRDHWWVQTSTDGIEWTDRDPLALRAGVALGATPSTTLALDELPWAEEHGLTVRVVAERVGASGIETAIALEHTAPARELTDRYLRLEFLPLNARRLVAAASGAHPEPADRTRLVAEQETEWLPVLVVVDPEDDEVSMFSASFRTDGSLDTTPTFDPSQGSAGRAAGVLAGLGAAPVAADPDVHLTAVWIEYEIRTPGVPPRTIRRNVFDLLGEVRRAAGSAETMAMPADLALDRGLALMGSTRILPVTGLVPPMHAVRIGLQSQLHNQRALVRHGAAVLAGDVAAFSSMMDELTLPPLDLWMLAQQRFSVGRHAERAFLGELNLFASHVQPLAAERYDDADTTDGAAADVTYASAIDVVANRVGVLAPRPDDADDADPADPWLVRLEQGVLDTVIENVALVGLDPAAPMRVVDEDPRMALDNAAMLMLERPPVEWSAFGPGDSLAASNDTLTRAAAALGAGQAVVLPGVADELAGMGSTSWWRVDAASGHTLGIGPLGWGQTGERVVLQARVAGTFVNPTRRLGVTILCRALVGASTIGYLSAMAGASWAGITAAGDAGGPGAAGAWGTGVGLASGRLYQSGALHVMLRVADARCRIAGFGRPSGSIPSGSNYRFGSAPTLGR